MRKFFIMTWLAIASVSLYAVDYDAMIDNLYYKFSGSTASVVGCTNIQDFPGAYQLTDGNFTFWVVDIIIPSTVRRNSTTYTVTSISAGAFRSSKQTSSRSSGNTSIASRRCRAAVSPCKRITTRGLVCQSSMLCRCCYAASSPTSSR